MGKKPKKTEKSLSIGKKLILILLFSCSLVATAVFAGFLMFPVLSILIAPNAVLYALKDSKDWRGIFYGKGTLQRFKDNEDFYRVKTPVDFEKRIYRAVIKDQLLNISTLVAFMFIIAVAGVIAILTYDSHTVSPGDVIGAVRYVNLRRGTGYMGFLLLLVLIFGFPVFVYSITNTIYKLRIVSGHKYMAYHAIVERMNGYVMKIDCDGRRYEYKYSTLVGMRSGQIQDTPAVLIFVPDDVLIFPDEIFKS